MVGECLTFWKTIKLFSKVTVPFCNPSRNIQAFRLLHHIVTTLQHLVLPVLLNLIHYSGCAVCHSDFNLHFLNNDNKYLYMCLYAIYISSLLSVYSNLFCPFFNWFALFSCKNSLYIPDTRYLSVFLFCKYFLPLCGLPFHFIHSIFRRAKVLNFEKIQLIDFFCLWLVLLYPI